MDGVRKCMGRVSILKLLLKKAVNRFEHMEIAEVIYEGVVEPYYKKTTGADSNRAGHRRKVRG